LWHDAERRATFWHYFGVWRVDLEQAMIAENDDLMLMIEGLRAGDAQAA